MCKLNKRERAPIVGMLAGVLLFAGALQAKTIALWKLDYEANTTAVNVRCMLDPANDWGINGSFSTGPAVDGWTPLPPNPDTTGNFLASPTNQTAISVNAVSTFPYTSLTNVAMSARVNITNSFTVEGWVFRVNNPSGTSWHYLVGNHIGGVGRWILSLRNGGTNWVLFVDGQVSDKSFPVLQDPASTNMWRHIALTYNRNGGSSQQGVWELFINAQSYGTITNTSRPGTLSVSDSVFMLGGRSSANNTGNAKLDYWRVSDTVLDTTRFLNAGTPAPVPEVLPRTIAYWRLDGNANGTLDTRDFVGNARLSGGLDLTNHVSTFQGSSEQAFAGQPANSTLTLPNGNVGSLYGQASGACLQVPNLGAQLETTNSFTVEGWMRPHRQDYTADLQYIANTRISTKGWAFALKKQSDNSLKFVIFAEDDAGYLCGDTPVSGDLSSWAYTWKHVALVYDINGGDSAQGTWSCYLDGTLQGVATNSHARSGASASSYFHLGGRVSNASQFCGYLDCWRICKAALTPSQFLNATNAPAAASDVLALWPLNAAKGLYIDATDVTGAWSFNTPQATNYFVTASTQQAITTPPFPDTTAAFKGSSAINAGSIIFNTTSDSAANAYLATVDATVRNTLCLTNSFTFEGWFYRTRNPGAWQILCAAGSTPQYAFGALDINFTYRSNGYVLHAMAAGFSDVPFGGTTDTGAVNTWRHIALVYDVTVGNGTWSLYVDGILQGTIENVTRPSRLNTGCFYIGGRPWSANSFNGAIDSVRLTKGVLTPAQFLNATAPAPTQPPARTIAYWKLDSDGSALNLASQVDPRYSLNVDSYKPAGSLEQCRRVVPAPDTSTNFIGDAQANAGSVSLATNYLRVQNLGYRVENDQAFTVEGWMKWNGATDVTPQTLVGTRFDSTYGWRLTLEKNGAQAAFRLFSATPTQTPLLNATFAYNAADLVGTWHHIALSYSPRLGDTGTWTLRVDGDIVSTLTNRFYPSVLGQSHWFMLGGCANGLEPFKGLLDCWRVSETALTREALLYRHPGGTILTVR